MSFVKDPCDGCGLRSRFSKENLAAEKERMTVCALSVLFWGMAAHAYVFFHHAFSHDSLTEFNAAVFGNDWKLQLGRVFVPAYRFLFRGDLNLPWLIGFLSLLFLFGAAELTAQIFEIRKKSVLFLLGGIYTANLTVSATAATFINDLDSNMLSLLLAVGAVYLWRYAKKGVWIGMLPVCLSLGLYQSYISTAISLILMVSVLELLSDGKFSDVFKKGMQAIGMLFGGGILYFLAMKGILAVSTVDLKTDNYNSVTGFTSLDPASIPALLGKDWLRTVYRILTVNASWPEKMIVALHLLLVLFAALCVIERLADKKRGIREKLLAVVLLLLLPIGMNVAFVLSGGMSHELMHFAFWLIYLLVLLLGERAEWPGKLGAKWGRSVAMTAVSAVIGILLWGNVRTANTLYLKKNLEYDANLSFFTRVLDRMEQTEGYGSGSTPVVFVELPVIVLQDVPGFEKENTITGMWKNYVPNGTDPWSYQAYFEYVLLNPAVMADHGVWNAMQEDPRVEAMPIFPAEGSVAMVDDVLVVKLGKRWVD